MSLVLSLPLSLTLSPAPFSFALSPVPSMPRRAPPSPPLAIPSPIPSLIQIPSPSPLPFFHMPLVRSLAPSLVPITSEPPERPLNYFALPPDHPFSHLFLPSLFLSLMSLVLFPSSFPASHSPACPTVWLHFGYHLVTFPWPFPYPCPQSYH